MILLDTWPVSRSLSRTIFTQARCAILPQYAARYALLVRIRALVLGQFAPVVRTTGSQPLCANLSGRPVIKSYGFYVEVPTVVSTVSQASDGPRAKVNDHMKTTMLAAQRQPIRSQIFSGSNVGQAASEAGSHKRFTTANANLMLARQPHGNI